MRRSFLRWGLVLAAVALPVGLARADAGLARHKQLYAVPAPGKVVVDGVLDDWDLSGQIEMYVVSETRDMQSARFALMYDTEALYLSGVVRDTSPMMNRQDPAVNGARGWDADSCQFRLTVDPAQAYPVNETAFDYRGKNARVDTRDDIKHLTLWYYTDRQQPCLQMHMGMGYRLPRPEWAPFGVVPAEGFSARYLPAPDARGYTYEYRVPWSTLGAGAPLKGGDLVAGTVQFNWGQADGLKTAGGSAWAYDVMSGPGFVFQNAAVWGKLLFAGQGSVARELVEAGVPAEKPLPLQFSYDLPEDGQVTLQLFDQENLVRRILVAQGDRRKGTNVERWDGMDDQGKPLLPGTYTCKGIIHQPIRTEFLFSAHNSGQPPYPTDDNKGGWGGDHGSPTACSAIPGGLILAWDGCEYGWGIIRVDLAGRKQWGSKQNSLFLANDGKRLYIYDPSGFQAVNGIRALDLADGRPVNFGDGNPHLQAPPGGTGPDTVSGLACAGGRLYASYAGRNVVAVFDSTSGSLETTWAVPSPGALAARPDGSLAVISDGSLAALREGSLSILQAPAPGVLDAPAGLAVGADGTIYVSNRGRLQNVSAFGADGRYRRAIGKAGGRPAVGNYDPAGVFEPAGLAVDDKDRLWVAEHADSPKRISVWADGAFTNEYFGGSDYFGYAFINPDQPDEIYCHNVLWRVDWDRKTTTPISTLWRKTAPGMLEAPSAGAYPQGFRSLTAADGRQYAIGVGTGDRKSILYRREGNVFKPCVASFGVSRASKSWPGLGSPELDDPKNTPDGWYLWQDANDDQCLQVAELHRYTDRNFRLGFKALAPDLTIWADGGNLLKPARRLENGQPVYAPAALEKTFLAGTPAAAGYLWLDPDGSLYTYTADKRPSLAKWSADGRLQWGYPGLVNWHNSLAMPVVTPGRIYGMTGPLGVAGDFTGNMTYFGVCHVFQRNGLYTALLMKDGRAGGAGPELGQPEGQGGQLVSVVTRPGTAPRTLLLGGGQDGRVTEVHGLDTVKALPDRAFTLTPEEAKTAAEALAAFNAKAGNNRLTVVAGRKALDTAPAVSKVLDGTRQFSARVARDATNLYIGFEVTAPYELISTIPEPKLLFKGGNCLDIQLATDPAADPQRKTPAPGDLRLLVTRQAAADKKTVKPLVVLFRPKVKAFAGEPVVLKSPTGTESFDEIAVVDSVGLEYRKTADGFKAVVTVPLAFIGGTLQKGQSLTMDLGYLYGNVSGNTVAARSYLNNNSFAANVVNDIPHESRLEPARWGQAAVE